MTFASYLGGIAALVSLVVPLTVGSVRLRATRLPELDGATARLAEIVIVLSGLVLTAELLGAVGLFRLFPLLLCTAVLGAVLWWTNRSGARAAEPGDEAPRPSQGSSWMTAVALVAALVVVAQWLAPTVTSLRQGITDFDSLHYHLPFAARFVQEGWVTRLHFAGPDPLQAFHPANGELLDAITILPFGRDLLIPFMNLGWLGVALTAGWCIGRRKGVSPLTLAATAVVVASPVTVFTMAGTAALVWAADTMNASRR